MDPKTTTLVVSPVSVFGFAEPEAHASAASSREPAGSMQRATSALSALLSLSRANSNQLGDEEEGRTDDDESGDEEDCGSSSSDEDREEQQGCTCGAGAAVPARHHRAGCRCCAAPSVAPTRSPAPGALLVPEAGEEDPLHPFACCASPLAGLGAGSPPSQPVAIPIKT